MSAEPCAHEFRFTEQAHSVKGFKVPAVISSKTKEELEVYVLDLLKRLKARDKRIEGDGGVVSGPDGSIAAGGGGGAERLVLTATPGAF